MQDTPFISSQVQDTLPVQSGVKDSILPKKTPDTSRSFSGQGQVRKTDSAALQSPAHTDTVVMEAAPVHQNRQVVVQAEQTAADTIVLAPDSIGSLSSVLPSHAAVVHKPVEYKDLFHGHELSPVHGEPLPRTTASPDWIFLILLFVTGVFTWLRIFYSKYFSQLFKAFINTNLTNQIVRDENILMQRASISLSLIFNLVTALFLYLISVHYGWGLGGIGTGFVRFIFFLILVSAVYALKFLILRICGWLFSQDREMATYTFNIFLINNLLGIALLPLIALIAYNEWIPGQWLITLSLVLAGAAFLYRIGRGIQLGMAVPNFSPLYLFLYLCTLEIAPLLVLLRLVYH